uniref:Uncharacterized protein n=1 Tax=Physcomitrium patens TaxID=3218 RepID=A0A2K1L232_PHYPA|nr:hypothetical protein PHYPA_002881 [Physcomitrium patens]
MVEHPGETHTVTCTRLTLVVGRHIFVRCKWFNASVCVTALEFPHSWSCNDKCFQFPFHSSTLKYLANSEGMGHC